MNFLRILFSCLAWALVLAVMLLIAAFIPALQTWAADWELHRAGVHGSIGDFSAAFGKLEADQVQLDSPDGTFKAAMIQAELPITGALFSRRFHFRNLTAKGWTLTLKPEASHAGEAPDQTAARAMAALLGGWKLPYDFSVDKADLEGDVVVLGPNGKDPARIHVKLNGGGLEPGKVGHFTIEATGALADPSLPIFAITADGQLFVTIEAQTISRLELKAHLSPRGSAIPNDLKLDGDLTALRGKDDIRYTADFSIAGRHFVALDAHLAEATGLLAGTWKANIKDADLPLFLKDQTFPAGAATGEGGFEADPNQGMLRVNGQIHATADHLGSLQPSWERFGAVVLNTNFEITHHQGTLQVARLKVAIDAAALSGPATSGASTARPQVTAELLQPVEFNETTNEYRLERPAADWIRGTAQGLPLAWVLGPTGPASLTGGAVAGHWFVRGDATNWTIRSEGPISAAAVAVAWNGVTGPADLDWSVTGEATHTATGWALHLNPLTLRDVQGVVATVTAQVTPPVAEGVAGKANGHLTVQLPALAPHLPAGAQRWLAGQTAASDFSVSLGTSILIEAQLKVAGQTADHHFEAKVHAEGSLDGAYNFTIPMHLTFGAKESSELEAEGSWSGSESSRLRLKLYSAAIAGENLTPLAAYLGGARPPGALAPTAIEPELTQKRTPADRPILGQTTMPGSAQTRPEVASHPDTSQPSTAVALPPFWGAGSGSITYQFDQLTYQGVTYREVAGSVEYDATSFRLMDGRVKFGKYTVTDATGGITYNPAVAQPYELNLKAPLGELRAEEYVPPAKKGEDPLLEGKFTLDVALVGSGRDRAELISAVRPVFKASSKGGIIRLLKTDVGAALPQHNSTVGDDVGGAASKLGSLMGIHGQLGGKNPVTDTAQNILEVTYDLAEIGFDQCSLTAVCQPDGSIDLQDVKLAAPDETFTGSGHIAADAHLPINQRPVTLDWQVGFRGHVAELMAKGGILTYQKGQAGYSTFSPDLHTSGTLAKLVMTGWRDLLVQAALKPDPPKRKK